MTSSEYSRELAARRVSAAPANKSTFGASRNALRHPQDRTHKLRKHHSTPFSDNVRKCQRQLRRQIMGPIWLQKALGRELPKCRRPPRDGGESSPKDHGVRGRQPRMQSGGSGSLPTLGAGGAVAPQSLARGNLGGCGPPQRVSGSPPGTTCNGVN